MDDISSTTPPPTFNYKTMPPCNLTNFSISVEDCVRLRNIFKTAFTTEKPPEWTLYVHETCYYGLPMLLVAAIIFCATNTISILRRMSTPTDLYLFGMSLASTFTALTGAALQLPRYLGHTNWYQSVYGPLISLHAWVWYSSLWMLVVCCMDIALSRYRNNAPSTSSVLQGIVITGLVFVVSLVSALPQFWAYQVVEATESSVKYPILLTVKSEEMNNFEYNTIYMWYLAIATLLVPYILLAVEALVLVHLTHRSVNDQKRVLENADDSETGLIAYWERKQENRKTCLCGFLATFCFIFTLPRSLHGLMLERQAGKKISEAQLAMADAFLLPFYFDLVLNMIIYCYYYSTIRLKPGRNCC